MKTAFDLKPDEFEDGDAEFLASIRDYGWCRTSINAGEGKPGFSYTTGFWYTLSFPELIVFSLQPEVAHQFFWNVYRAVEAGNRPPIGEQTSAFSSNSEEVLLAVSPEHYHGYLGWSLWFYRWDEFPCHQLIWPDTKGRFPWHGNFEERFGPLQPDLTTGHWAGMAPRS